MKFLAGDYKLIVGVNNKIAHVALLRAKPSTRAPVHLRQHSERLHRAHQLHARARGPSWGQTEQGGNERASQGPCSEGFQGPRGGGHHLLCPRAAAPSFHLHHPNPWQHPLLAPQRQSGVMQLYFLGSGQSLISPALSLLAELTLTPFFSLP